MPTASEVLDILDRLERDPERRQLLASGYQIFRACIDEALLNEDSIDWLGQRMQQLFGEGLIAHGPVSGGVREPAVWDGNWLQSAHEWRVTSAGRADAALYRREGQPPLARDGRSSSRDNRDLFISHASEDKESVARPLSEALMTRGWSVWLDELELTIGDSLSGRIDAALARSRFGVVVLSPAFFAKPWPQRELAGLAAREVDAGTKVILPVWHTVDRQYILQRSPVLADKLGAPTTLGIEEVANRLSRALEHAGVRASVGSGPEAVVQAVEPERGPARFTIPSTADEQARLVSERPKFWEYLLFVGVLVQGRNELETKWDDHELRLPRGTRREVDEDSAPSFMSRELGWMSKQVGVLERILAPSVQEQAFGPPGEPGDPVRIKSLARRLVAMYESLLDWAASLRNTSAPSAVSELVETTACFVDAPIRQIREFIDEAADQMAALPELTAEATIEHPVKVELTLKLDVDPTLQERHAGALKRAERELSGGD
jgi:TIR domain